MVVVGLWVQVIVVVASTMNGATSVTVLKTLVAVNTGGRGACFWAVTPTKRRAAAERTDLKSMVGLGGAGGS
ncbi:hypothetical protein FB45DRAFT_933790 [Roridomyces roridus]|uniref:Uncharacterized protein n=1 Tax=Roridomyces roridus TaxID=1738132 RepID=A0AAD7BCM2_9AGAR|nr:hypothetical protein FB45DRAFT_933790 [Roridomyces roridus]